MGIVWGDIVEESVDNPDRPAGLWDNNGTITWNALGTAVAKRKTYDSLWGSRHRPETDLSTLPLPADIILNPQKALTQQPFIDIAGVWGAFFWYRKNNNEINDITFVVVSESGAEGQITYTPTKSVLELPTGANLPEGSGYIFSQREDKTAVFTLTGTAMNVPTEVITSARVEQANYDNITMQAGLLLAINGLQMSVTVPNDRLFTQLEVYLVIEFASSVELRVAIPRERIEPLPVGFRWADVQGRNNGVQPGSFLEAQVAAVNWSTNTRDVTYYNSGGQTSWPKGTIFHGYPVPEGNIKNWYTEYADEKFQTTETRYVQLTHLGWGHGQSGFKYWWIRPGPEGVRITTKYIHSISELTLDIIECDTPDVSPNLHLPTSTAHPQYFGSSGRWGSYTDLSFRVPEGTNYPYNYDDDETPFDDPYLTLRQRIDAGDETLPKNPVNGDTNWRVIGRIGPNSESRGYYPSSNLMWVADECAYYNWETGEIVGAEDSILLSNPSKYYLLVQTMTFNVEFAMSYDIIKFPTSIVFTDTVPLYEEFTCNLTMAGADEAFTINHIMSVKLVQTGHSPSQPNYKVPDILGTEMSLDGDKITVTLKGIATTKHAYVRVTFTNRTALLAKIPSDKITVTDRQADLMKIVWDDGTVHTGSSILPWNHPDRDQELIESFRPGGGGLNEMKTWHGTFTTWNGYRTSWPDLYYGADHSSEPNASEYLWDRPRAVVADPGIAGHNYKNLIYRSLFTINSGSMHPSESYAHAPDRHGTIRVEYKVAWAPRFFSMNFGGTNPTGGPEGYGGASGGDNEQTHVWAYTDATFSTVLWSKGIPRYNTDDQVYYPGGEDYHKYGLSWKIGLPTHTPTRWFEIGYLKYNQHNRGSGGIIHYHLTAD